MGWGEREDAQAVDQEGLTDLSSGPGGSGRSCALVDAP